ncbi:MAG: helix-turn-helix domain-containing protein [Candidatus Brocadiaceae bacterium]|nr:helix-turn-helix domain-containing protein [Candidatus Brocadiaceae bacterium]
MSVKKTGCVERGKRKDGKTGLSGALITTLQDARFAERSGINATRLIDLSGITGAKMVISLSRLKKLNEFYINNFKGGTLMTGTLKMLPNVDKLLNMDEASDFLGIKKSTLYAMVMRKQITHVKLGKLTRFRPEDLQAYINRNRVEERLAPGQV